MKQWIVLGLLPVSALAETPNWKTEMVDAICPGSRAVEIEFDRGGELYLGYTGCQDQEMLRGTASILKIAKRAGEVWKSETVDTSSPDVGRHPNISFDSKNGLHVVYADHESWRMKHAYRPAGKTAFEIEEIGSDLGGYWVSGGFIGGALYGTHTRFSDKGYGSPRLELVTIRGGETKSEIIQKFNGGWNTFVGGNDASGPVIASMAGFAGYRGDLVISRLNRGAWVHEPIDSLTAKPEVVVDSAGFLHATYSQQDKDNNKLDNVVYATNAPGGEWKSEIIAGNEDETDDALFSTIAVDKNGAVHIAYKNYRDRLLMYKRRVSPGAPWEKYRIDGKGNPVYSRLKLDGQGRLHLAYEKSENIFYGICQWCVAE